MQLEIQLNRLAFMVSYLGKETFPNKEEILTHVENKIAEKFGWVTKRSGLSDSTFERDKKEICSIYNCKIKYSKVLKGYYLDYSETNTYDMEQLNRLIEYVHKNDTGKFGGIIQLEQVNVTGLDNLNDVLHSIQHKQFIQFNYENYNEGTIDSHKIAPGLVKEFKRRAYIIGKDSSTGKTMSFSFERISDFEVLTDKFDFTPVDKDYLNNCYGIVDYDDYQAQRTLIKAYGAKAKYIANHKLHHSQEISMEGENFTIFELFVKPTYDFIIELISHSHQLEVLEPDYLRSEIKWRLEDTLKFYS